MHYISLCIRWFTKVYTYNAIEKKKEKEDKRREVELNLFKGKEHGIAISIPTIDSASDILVTVLKSKTQCII